jgi:hypothetical protein
MDIRSQILAADDLPREAVAVPEWGGVTVWVRTLTGTERDRFETQGARLFADGDAGALGKKSSKALDRLLEVAMRLSGIGAKQQEEAEKNSETTTGAASSSG